MSFIYHHVATFVAEYLSVMSIWLCDGAIVFLRQVSVKILTLNQAALQNKTYPGFVKRVIIKYAHLSVVNNKLQIVCVNETETWCEPFSVQISSSEDGDLFDLLFFHGFCPHFGDD